MATRRVSEEVWKSSFTRKFTKHPPSKPIFLREYSTLVCTQCSADRQKLFYHI